MWLHIPSTCFPCAAELMASVLPSNLLYHRLARFAMSRGKRIASKSWSGACKKASWMNARFGATLKHSVARVGVARWIASLRAIRASRSALPESNLQKPIHGICGRTLLESLASASRRSSSLKTSPAMSLLVCPTLPLTCEGWGLSCLDRSCLQLQTWERPSAVSGYSSLLTKWGTPRESEHKEPVCSEQAKAKGFVALCEQARNFPTTQDAKQAGSKNADRMTLTQAVKQMWPTPYGMANTDASGHEAGAAGEFAKAVEQTVELWATPNATVANDGESPSTFLKRQAGLKETANNGNGCGTPLAIMASLFGQDHAQIAEPTKENGTPPIAQGRIGATVEAMEQWASASASDHKGSSKPGQRRGQLSEQTETTESITGLQVQPPEASGSESLPSGQISRRRLNPRFVEWLQGLQSGWVQLEPMSCEAWETWLCQSRERLRFLSL